MKGTEDGGGGGQWEKKKKLKMTHKNIPCSWIEESIQLK